MTSSSSERDNALRNLQREFDHVWNGFDRNQVREHLEGIQSDIQRVIAERDSALTQVNALSQQLESARAEIGKLQERVEELSVPPKDLDDLDQRMQRVGHLAYLKADEVITRAQTAAEENWKETAEASMALRERYRSLLQELDAHAEALHTEHRTAIEETRAEVKKLTVDAVRRRDRLDAEEERKRRSIEQEFESHITSQRNALEKYIADQRTASKNQAQRRLAEATSEAQRLMAEATKEAGRMTNEANAIIGRLATVAENANTHLQDADEVLDEGQAALEPLEDELLPAPRAADTDNDAEGGHGPVPTDSETAEGTNRSGDQSSQPNALPQREPGKPRERPQIHVGTLQDAADTDDRS